MNQISPENTVSIEELQSAFNQSYGSMIAKLTTENLSLEKRLSAQGDYIQKLTANEAALEQHIQGLEADVARLRYQLSAIPKPLSPELAEKAAEAKSVINDAEASAALGSINA